MIGNQSSLVCLLVAVLCLESIGVQHTYEFGACEQQLMWRDGGDVAAQLEHLDAMKKAGVGWVRLSLIYSTDLDNNLLCHPAPM